jgi:hypothetical protein
VAEWQAVMPSGYFDGLDDVMLAGSATSPAQTTNLMRNAEAFVYLGLCI